MSDARMPASDGSSAAPLTEGLLLAFEDCDEPAGVLDGAGVLYLMNAAILTSLGFDAGDDLSGLHLSSLFPKSARTDVQQALYKARDCGAAELALDLAYLTGSCGTCVLTLTAMPSGAFRLTIG